VIKRIAIIDYDPVVHVVANVQWSAGNRTDEQRVRDHVQSFVNTVRKNSNSENLIEFFQGMGHENYRKTLLPEYKGHRKKSEGVAKWKPIICDQLKKLGANELLQIESDDALMLYSEKCKKAGYDYLIVENDKDLAMISGDHYNPFKAQPKGKPPLIRWYSFTPDQARYSLWQQAVTGDATDMPNEFCGMEGIGPAKAKKILGPLSDNVWMYPHRTMKAYVTKYGVGDGLRRMAITYDMVFLLRVPSEKYPESKKVWAMLPVAYQNTMENLFDNKAPSNNLFDNQ
jgi:5'-3' exonuclease